MTQGFISIRNEDGTQWLCGVGVWSSLSRGRRPHERAEFEKLQSIARESQANNGPDSGYFGLMNLTWHPCTEAQAAEAVIAADQFDCEMAEQEAEEDRLLTQLYGEQS